MARSAELPDRRGGGLGRPPLLGCAADFGAPDDWLAGPTRLVPRKLGATETERHAAPASLVARGEILGRPDAPEPSENAADAEQRMLAQVSGRHALSSSIVARLRSTGETAAQGRLSYDGLFGIHATAATAQAHRRTAQPRRPCGATSAGSTSTASGGAGSRRTRRSWPNAARPNALRWRRSHLHRWRPPIAIWPPPLPLPYRPICRRVHPLRPPRLRSGPHPGGAPRPARSGGDWRPSWRQHAQRRTSLPADPSPAPSAQPGHPAAAPPRGVLSSMAEPTSGPTANVAESTAIATVVGPTPIQPSGVAAPDPVGRLQAPAASGPHQAIAAHGSPGGPLPAELPSIGASPDRAAGSAATSVDTQAESATGGPESAPGESDSGAVHGVHSAVAAVQSAITHPETSRIVPPETVTAQPEDGTARQELTAVQREPRTVQPEAATLQSATATVQFGSAGFGGSPQPRISRNPDATQCRRRRPSLPGSRPCQCSTGC